MADHECRKITHWPPVLNPPPKVSFGIKLFKCKHVRYQVSHVMRKPVYAICKQQRLRSDCASTQSDQQFCGSLLCSIIPIVAKPKVSSLSLVSVVEQTSLSLTWSHTTEDRFSEIKLVLMRALTLSMYSCCGRGHCQCLQQLHEGVAVAGRTNIGST